MNKEHTEYLYKNFSFFHPEEPLTKSLMGFGFECGDGWFELIKELCEKLQKMNLEGFSVLQVKEKFGGLCFYVGLIETEKADTVYRLINEAESKSYKICEICGFFSGLCS